MSGTRWSETVRELARRSRRAGAVLLGRDVELLAPSGLGNEGHERDAQARESRSRFSGPEAYETRPPSPQTAVDVFQDEWTTELPASSGAVSRGTFPAFSDGRITWALGQLGGVLGKRVLELGPLEGGHTSMLLAAGASEVVAVEANARAFLRCLVVKELCGLQNARFVHGDLVGYMQETAERFDVCVASGVLYHLLDPVALIALTAKCSRELFVWTQYYDDARAARDAKFAHKIVSSHQGNHAGFAHTLYRVDYHSASSTFCGGTAGSANWLSRDDILAACAHFGWGQVQIAFDEPDHVNGPAMAFTARRL